MASRESSTLVERRLVATIVDYLCLAAGVLVVLVAFRSGGGTIDVSSPTAGQLLGLLTVTVPGVAFLTLFEATGGSPGKRLVGIKVVPQTPGMRPRWRIPSRTLGKYAVPWELGHAAVWQLVFDSVGLTTWVLLAGAYLLPIGAAFAVLVRRRPWYDAICGTTVHLAK